MHSYLSVAALISVKTLQVKTTLSRCSAGYTVCAKPSTLYALRSAIEQSRHRSLSALQGVYGLEHNIGLGQTCNSSHPGVHCPCKPASNLGQGACSAGSLCTALWDPADVAAHVSVNATPRCWPCSLGQFCPAGSYLTRNSSAVTAEVEKYTCK